MPVQTIVGVTIPDSPRVQDVTTLICDAEDDLLSDHSRLAEARSLSAIDQLLDSPEALKSTLRGHG